MFSESANALSIRSLQIFNRVSYVQNSLCSFPFLSAFLCHGIRVMSILHYYVISLIDCSKAHYVPTKTNIYQSLSECMQISFPEIFSLPFIQNHFSAYQFKFYKKKFQLKCLLCYRTSPAKTLALILAQLLVISNKVR